MKPVALRGRVRRVERARSVQPLPPGPGRPSAWNRLSLEQLRYMIEHDGAFPPGMPGELCDALAEDVPPIYATLTDEQLDYIIKFGKAPPGIHGEDLL